MLWTSILNLPGSFLRWKSSSWSQVLGCYKCNRHSWCHLKVMIAFRRKEFSMISRVTPISLYCWSSVDHLIHIGYTILCTIIWFKKWIKLELWDICDLNTTNTIFRNLFSRLDSLPDHSCITYQIYQRLTINSIWKPRLICRYWPHQTTWLKILRR